MFNGQFIGIGQLRQFGDIFDNCVLLTFNKAFFHSYANKCRGKRLSYRIGGMKIVLVELFTIVFILDGIVLDNNQAPYFMGRGKRIERQKKWNVSGPVVYFKSVNLRDKSLFKLKTLISRTNNRAFKTGHVFIIRVSQKNTSNRYATIEHGQ